MKINRQLKKLTQLSSRYSFNKLFEKKIKGILKHHDAIDLTIEQKKKINHYFAENGIKISRFYWHKLYTTLNGEFSEKYVPEDIFYTKLEPFLNKSQESFPALLDKNLLSKLFINASQANTIVKNINGCFVNDKDQVIGFDKAVSQVSKFENFVIKPSIHSGGGRKVGFHRIKEINVESWSNYISNLFSSYDKNFIIQEILKQNETMKKLNPTSINTIRVLSFLENDSVKILSSYVRMGAKGSFADNISTGGLCCGINPDGSLHKFGWNSILKKFTDNGNDVQFEQFTIPFIEQIHQEVEIYHQCIPYFKLVSWDIAIDHNDKVTLIEFNTIYQDINGHQVINGPILETVIEQYGIHA